MYIHKRISLTSATESPTVRWTDRQRRKINDRKLSLLLCVRGMLLFVQTIYHKPYAAGTVILKLRKCEKCEHLALRKEVKNIKVRDREREREMLKRTVVFLHDFTTLSFNTH